MQDICTRALLQGGGGRWGAMTPRPSEVTDPDWPRKGHDFSGAHGIGYGLLTFSFYIKWLLHSRPFTSINLQFPNILRFVIHRFRNVVTGQWPDMTWTWSGGQMNPPPLCGYDIFLSERTGYSMGSETRGEFFNPSGLGTNPLNGWGLTGEG